MAKGKTRKSSARILIGTSSFSSKDWVGPFYPEGTKPGEFLRYYSQFFNTVEVDATYYRVPAVRMIESWNNNTPEDFIISAKFPRAIVHAGDGPRPDADAVLTPDVTYEIRDSFLDVISSLGKRLGTLVLQFPYFSRQHFSSAKKFYERLNDFLDDLPDGFSYGVEIRNRNWLKPEFAELLRRHNVALVLADQAWMPHGDEVQEMFDPVTSDHLYVRLIGNRKEIEAITKTWEKEVIDRTDSLKRWADMLTHLYRHQVNSLVYVNNHYAGHAPATARALDEMIEASIMNG
jgi:uncharacterized protein YecE (DUF72 family)